MTETETRSDKKTPQGGDYSIVYWLDDEEKPVKKEQATKVKIIEYTKDNEVVGITYGDLNPKKEES